MIDNINKMINSKDNYKLNKKIIAGALVAGIALGTASIISNPNDINNNPAITETVEENNMETKQITTLKFESKNPESIDEKAKIIVLNSENVIYAVIQVKPDGSINDEEITVYPNQDYHILLIYNGTRTRTDFYIGESDEKGNTITIDYATGSVEVSADQDVKTR